jgi:long-chain acyl-CoA synthetase
VAAFAVFKAGCVLVNVNPLYTAEEMGKQFEDAEPHALIIIDMFADKVPVGHPRPPDPQHHRHPRGGVLSVHAARDRGAGAEILGPFRRADRTAHIRLPDAIAAGRAHRAKDHVEVSDYSAHAARRRRRAPVYRRHDGVFQGCDADPREPDREHGTDLRNDRRP